MQNQLSKTWLPLLLLSLLLGCSHRDDSGIDLRRSVENEIANIPPQCFTRTRSANGHVQNPCYVCHAEVEQPNFQSQPENQLSYAFPLIRSAKKVRNDWKNLFVDRGPAIAAMPDAEVLSYVRNDNYRLSNGDIDLAKRLTQLPKKWDVNGNGRWDGYMPDAGFHFDKQGFDHDSNGQLTGWRAFAYVPFPGSFMPTNGSFDDVLIRLPAAFRQRENGQADSQVYAVNLAIVESLLRRSDVALDGADERALGIDLDHDGKLGNARRVKFDWAPTQGRTMSYVGLARVEQQAGRLHAAAGLLPEGVEFLHSVRYLDLDSDGTVQPAIRMKELRYSRKNRWVSYSDLRQQALLEAKEAALSPDRPEQYLGDAEHGMLSPMGWTYQGFIEDSKGRLRPQTREESQFCLGCHGGLSATDDTVFSLGRKLQQGPASGWYHWGTRPFQQMTDPIRKDGKPEFATYLLNNRAGDEYRANDEVLQRFFTDAGQPREEAFARMSKDLSYLMLPSAKRALALNKAYRLIVREQSFALGRDAVLKPAENVWDEVAQDSETGIQQPLTAPRLAVMPNGG